MNPALNRLAFVLSLLGMLVAAYLWYAHILNVDVPCGGSNDCETVANSRYARFPVGEGPPVAAYGTAGYLALAGLAFLRTLSPRPDRDRLLLGLMALGAAAGSLFSLYLTYVELFVLQAVCKWCLASQFLILGVAVTAAIEWLRGARTAPSPLSETISPS